LSLSTGTYKFQLASQENIQAEVTALIKYAKKPPTQGTLNINFHFVGVTGINAASAPTDASFQQVVSHCKKVFSAAGIQLGQLSYFDITDPALAVIDTFAQKGSELGRLFALSRQHSNKAANVFFVREIKSTRGITILGFSGGIPGPGAMHGTPSSGIAATAEGFQQSPSRLAKVITHELAHFLGLYHTSERNGLAHDPLSDTPQCPATRDANGDGIVDGQECDGFGTRNLMFWIAAPNYVQISLTPHQRFVLLRNSLIQ